MIVVLSLSGSNSPLHPEDEGTPHSFDTSGTTRPTTWHHMPKIVESPLLSININCGLTFKKQYIKLKDVPILN
jgi:hypothetical protein